MNLSYSCLFVALALVTSVAEARPEESSAPGSTSVEQARTPDFLFGQPSFTLAIKGEWVQARAESEIFVFVSELLTLERRDFHAPGLAVDVAFPLNSRLDAVGGFDVSRSAALSNYRDFVDADELEIRQETSLTQVNVSGSLELALLPRGQSVGEHAWIPSRVVPYVGGGGGLLSYRFQQTGDFVDFVDMSVFQGYLRSSGWTTSRHVYGGVDIGVNRRVSATFEVRYRWTDASMSGDFVGFGPIDLTGARVTGGVQFAF